MLTEISASGAFPSLLERLCSVTHLCVLREGKGGFGHSQALLLEEPEEWLEQIYVRAV